jgi:hypothetical protein
MRSPHARLLALSAVLSLVAAACSGDEVASPTPEPVAQTGAAAPASAVEQTGPGAPQCAGDAGIAGDIPGWPLVGGGDARFLPMVASSLVTAGPSRFLYNVLDPAYRQLAAPDVASTVEFYAIERDPDTPTDRVDAAYLAAGLGRGLYRATTEFDCVGEWGAEITVELADGSEAGERLRFFVHALGSTPAIGEPVPLSDSLTAATPEDVARISTDPHPYPAAYDTTIAETVTSGRPSLVFFATPAFCQTGFCGPTVELVKSVARDYEGAVEFVNVEPYQLHVTENGLQPLLDEAGQLQPVQAALDYGIPVEPYLFLVDAEGRTFAKFEGIMGADELRAAIEDVLAA